MRRFKLTVGGCAAIALLIVPVAQAGGGPQYQGRVEKDKQTAFGFDVKKNGDGKKVAQVSAVLPYSCERGAPGGSAFSAYSGAMHVSPSGAFSGKLKSNTFLARGTASAKATIEVDGKLGKKGKAHGTLSSDVIFSGMRGSRPTEHCYTGILDWKVKRGARITVPARGTRWAQ